jgi:hypothetical protein
MRPLGMLAVLLLAGTLALLVAGCGSEGGKQGEDAEQLYQAGVAELESDLQEVDGEAAPWDWEVDVSDAYQSFDSALDSDPAHCGALLGASVTRLLMVLTDPELGTIMRDLFPDDPALGRKAPLFWYLQKPDVPRFVARVRVLSRDQFAFSELQGFVEQEVLPALNEVDSRLDRFEQLNCEVVVVIDTPDTAGAPGARDSLEVEIDATDAYFIHTPLDIVQAAMNVLCSYNVDVEDGESLEYLLDSDPDFLTLRSGPFMPTAYDELEEAVDHVYEACSSLEAETDPQVSDLVTLSDGYLPLEELLGEDPLGQIRDVAGAADDALAGGFSLNPSDHDSEAPDIDILIDINELFNDPLDDIRDYLPAHGWGSPDSISVYRPIDFPDPTFSDICPGMTDAEWEQVINWMDGTR